MKKKVTITIEELDETPDNWGQNNWGTRQFNDPCANCPNNPANNPNASGICNCVLPYMAGTKYQITCTGSDLWKIT